MSCDRESRFPSTIFAGSGSDTLCRLRTLCDSSSARTCPPRAQLTLAVPIVSQARAATPMLRRPCCDAGRRPRLAAVAELEEDRSLIDAMRVSRGRRMYQRRACGCRNSMSEQPIAAQRSTPRAPLVCAAPVRVAHLASRIRACRTRMARCARAPASAPPLGRLAVVRRPPACNAHEKCRAVLSSQAFQT